MRGKSFALVSRWSVVLGMLLSSLPATSQATEDPVITVPRDGHAVVDFFANHNWSSRNLGGEVLDADSLQPISDASVELWRLEGCEDLSRADRERVRKLTVDGLRNYVRESGGRLKLREIARSETSADGRFAFENLKAGFYSVQFNWKTLGERSFVEFVAHRPTRLHSSLAAFLATEGYRPPPSSP